MVRPKRPTLIDVAKEAGCSPALASIVMRDAAGASAEMRSNVRAAAARLGYRPDRRAQNLRRARSMRIGVLFTVDNPFHANLVTAFWHNARRTGYEMILAISAPDEKDRLGIESLLEERCEALIILGSDSTDKELGELNREIPLIVIGKAVDEPGIDVVRVNDAQMVAEAMQHLFRQGHRRIAHIDGGSSPGAVQRARAYAESMEKANLGPEIWEIHGGWHYEHGRRAAREILGGSRELPTAILAFNDLAAVGAMHEFFRQGIRVPDDVSIVGFDDTAGISSVVPLTTIAQDVRTMARVAWDRAVERASGREGGTEQVLPGRLQVRHSVRSVADGASLSNSNQT